MIPKKLLKKDNFIIPVLCLLIFIVFLPSINYPVLNGWDDQMYILNNNYLEFNLQNFKYFIFNHYYHMYTPLTMFSYMIDHYFCGYSHEGYHIQNIIWHAVACVFVYKNFRLFKLNQYLTFFIVLIFAVHPQRVESVVWISERKDVLCAAFYSVCLYIYIKNAKEGKGFSISALIFYLCAFLSKPMAMSIPFVLLFFEFAWNKKMNIKYYIKKLWPYFVILLVFLYMAFKFQAKADSKFFLFQQLYVVLYNVVWYINKTLIPINLNPVYPRTDIVNTWAYLIVIYISMTLLMAIMFIKYKKDFIYIFAPIILCYLVSLAPVSGFVKWGSFDKADRWSYIPSIFIWLVLTIIFNRFLQKKKSRFQKSIVYTGGILYLTVLITVNMIYQKNWQDVKSIYSVASSFYPANKYAMWHLCKYEMKDGNFLKAYELAERIEKSNNLADKYRADYIKAEFYFINKNYEMCIKQLNFLSVIKPEICVKILDYKDTYNKALSIAAESCLKLKEIEKAVKYFDDIISFNSDDPEAVNYFKGKKNLACGNKEKALHFFKQAKKANPKNKAIKQ